MTGPTDIGGGGSDDITFSTNGVVRNRIDGDTGAWSSPSEANQPGLLKVAKRRFTHAEIVTLPTTPIIVVPAPGLGKYLVPLYALIEANFTTAYTPSDPSADQGASDLVITWGINAVNACRPVPMNYFSGIFSLTNKRIAICRGYDGVSDPVVAADQLWAAAYGYAFNDADRLENNALRLSADNAGDFTGGAPANVLTVCVYYFERTFENIL